MNTTHGAAQRLPYTIAAEPGGQLARYAGPWCVPASPYRDTEAALRAIRHAREYGVPLLGTCGGVLAAATARAPQAALASAS
jgi:CTP synthase (UTP-ammonia lyase)